jgi:formamidopyrimidine-DNA glycosylase
MPELPEVQTIVNTLAPRVIEQTIVDVRIFRSDFVTPARFNLAGNLIGRTISSIDRRGKRIVFSLDDSNRFYIHLGMSGRLTIEEPTAPVLIHTHLIIQLCDGAQLRLRDPRRFGGIFWLGSAQGEDSLGPEPLLITPRELARRLGKTRRAIKIALLDQKLLAGLGNIYADEALFEAQINPRKQSNRLSGEQSRRLNRAIRKVLRRAIKHKGSTLRDYVDGEGNAGRFQRLHCVYGRAGAQCMRCGQKIKRIVLGGRSTHFCPRCQAKRARSSELIPPHPAAVPARGSTAIRE